MDSIFKIMFYGCLAVVEFLATTTTVHIKIIESMWDKANHFIAFFVLYFLFSLAYNHLSSFVRLILLLAFGIQIEIVQSFIKGREASFLDIVADSVGIVVGFFVLRFIASHFVRIYKIYFIPI